METADKDSGNTLIQVSKDVIYLCATDCGIETIMQRIHSYTEEQTTSQQQTIERLRELVMEYKELCTPVLATVNPKKASLLNHKAEQFLNTTEPTQQKPDKKCIVGINIDDKHYLHFRTTDLGFGIYAYDSEGNRVNCHAGKIYDGDFKNELYKNKVKIKGLLWKFEEE